MHVPYAGGLYALYRADGRLVYIGTSANVRNRLTYHLQTKPGIKVAKVSFAAGVYKREQRLIRRLRPLLNVRITYRNQRDATR